MDHKDFIKTHTEEMTEALFGLLRIPSVKDDPAPNAPYGKEIRKALDYMKELCEGFGFDVTDVDGHVLCCDYGNGEKTLGVMTHLDVVPAEGFSKPAFEPYIKEGKIIARGAMDNKGPAIASLFALASLKQSAYVPSMRIRLLFGCDEESGWHDMEYYAKSQPMPDIGFSPDGDYPLINSEKGVLHISIKLPKDNTSLFKLCNISAGERVNMVPGSAECVICGDLKALQKALQEHKTEHVWFELNEDTLLLKAKGVSAHGSTPEKGKNALTFLLEALLQIEDFNKPAIKTLFALATGIFGQNHGLDIKDESGRLTLNLGRVRMDGGFIFADVDIRYPISMSVEKTISTLKKTIEHADFEILSTHESHFVPEDNDLVRKLLDCYATNTGNKAYCLSIGGATYARTIPNAVTFGCSFPDEPSTAHEKDEFIKQEQFLLNAIIMADAMIALTKAD